MTEAQLILSAPEAQRLTMRIKLTATTVRDNMRRLWDLVEEAKRGNAWQVLGHGSWTAYLSDTLGEEPLRLSRDERQEVVAMLAQEGLSTRAIAPIVDASQRTVADDIRAGEQNRSPAEPVPAAHSWDLPAWATAPPAEEQAMPGAPVITPKQPVTDTPPAPADAPTELPRTVMGLDGKTYTPSPPAAPRRKSLPDAAQNAGWELRKAIEKVQRIVEDDRFRKNEDEVMSALRPHIEFAATALAGITTYEESR